MRKCREEMKTQNEILFNVVHMSQWQANSERRGKERRPPKENKILKLCSNNKIKKKWKEKKNKKVHVEDTDDMISSVNTL